MGAAIVVVPWLFGAGPLVIVNNLVVGVVLIALSLPRGMIHERHGSWEPYIRWTWRRMWLIAARSTPAGPVLPSGPPRATRT